MINRESIFVALFDLLQTVPGVITFSRKLAHWDDVPASQQPALYLSQIDGGTVQGNTQIHGQPRRWTIRAEVYVYVRTDGDQIPGSVLNPILDAIEALLAPSNAIAPVQTLGGLVEHCYIDGKIETDEGTLGDQAVAVIPIEILAL